MSNQIKNVMNNFFLIVWGVAKNPNPIKFLWLHQNKQHQIKFSWSQFFLRKFSQNKYCILTGQIETNKFDWIGTVLGQFQIIWNTGYNHVVQLVGRADCWLLLIVTMYMSWRHVNKIYYCHFLISSLSLLKPRFSGLSGLSLH